VRRADREACSGYRRGASPSGLGFATAAAICREGPPLRHLRCLVLSEPQPAPTAGRIRHWS